MFCLGNFVEPPAAPSEAVASHWVSLAQGAMLHTSSDVTWALELLCTSGVECDSFVTIIDGEND